MLQLVAEKLPIVLAGTLAFRVARLPDFSIVVSGLLAGGLFALASRYEFHWPIVLLACVVPILVASLVWFMRSALRISALAASIAILFLSYVPLRWIANYPSPVSFSTFSTNASAQISLELNVSGWWLDLVGSGAFAAGAAAALLFLGFTKAGLVYRIVAETGPSSRNRRTSWQFAVLVVLILSHLLASLYGMQLAARGWTITYDTFLDALIWTIIGVSCGEIAYRVATRASRLFRFSASQSHAMRPIGAFTDVVTIGLLGAVAWALIIEVVSDSLGRQLARPAAGLVLLILLLVFGQGGKGDSRLSWKFHD